MEREGEMRKERRGRRGILIGGMVIGLLMGCNNGGENAEGNLGKAMIDIGKNVESLFYSFMDLTSNALGLGITGTTKKKEIGTYYGKISNGIEKIKAELDKINLTEIDPKTAEINTTIDSSKKTLESLKKHVDELKTIGNDELNVAEAASSNYGITVDDAELNKTVEALKGILKVAKDSKVITTDLKNSSTEMSSVTGSSPQNGAKILGISGSAPSANDEGKATAILSKVSGEEILAAIIASTGSEGELRSGADNTTTAAQFAKGGSDSNAANARAKVSAVAGGIALRSILKGGKLGAETNGKEVAQGIGISAASKLILKVEDLIKRIIHTTLETVKTALETVKTTSAGTGGTAKK